MSRTGSLLWLAALALLVGCCAAAPLNAVEIGDRIEPFTLPDVHGRDRTIEEFADARIVVVAFLGTECPLARLYGPRLQELADKYADQRVAFVGVDANVQDSLSDMTAFARQYEIKFPLWKDRDQTVADRFGVMRNPEVFVLDRERKVRYRGRIDDQFGQGGNSGYARPEVKARHLGDALDQLLAGQAVATPVTTATGCLVARKAKTQPSGEVTYTKHIAPLLQQHCVSCHRPGQVGPFALMDYDEVIGWGPMIEEVVSQGRMPPWSASPDFGHFANDARLSDDEKKLIRSWVAGGCTQGDPADLAAPKKWVDGWIIGEPDQVVRVTKPYKVPAEGVIPYQMFVVDPGWTEDKWIQQAEVLPSNHGVVHHIIAAIAPPGSRVFSGEVGEGAGTGDRTQRPRGRGVGGTREVPMGEDFGGSKLTSYVPGRPPTVYQPGVAMFAQAGSKLLFQVHYTPNGRECEDQDYIGLVFADAKTVKKRAHVLGVTGFNLEIPPHDDNYKLVAENPIHTDQLLLSMSPHMHLRGKSFRYEAVFPDGTSEILVDVPKYDFNWQLTYVLATPKLLPAGSKLQCVAHYDNSENNFSNPDPERTVTWGPQTWDEMMIGYYATVTVKDDAEGASAAARKAAEKAPATPAAQPGT